MTKVLVSGIQPTGALHIGNYWGFIRSFVAFQNDPTFARRVLLIADLHSMSTGYLQDNSQRLNVHRTLAALLACGIDPEKTMLVQQSRIPEHSELMWILGSAATVPSLTSLVQFKHKAKDYADGSVPIGLLTYPLLQAADVLTYRATHVTVGDDQSQHMDIVRHLAKKFNLLTHCDFFPIPERVSSECARLKSLRDPSGKMSKSDRDPRSRIEITDTPDAIVEKIRKAVSDSTSKVTFEPMERPGVSNLVSIFSLFSGLTTDQVVRESDGLNTMQFKGKLAELLNEQLLPIRKNYLKFLNNEELALLMRNGEERVRPFAVETLQEVKKIVGLI